MKKSTKLILVLLVIVILAVIIIIGNKIIAKPEYTAEEMLDLVEIKLADNMYFKEELYKEDSTEINYTNEKFLKDNVLYEKEKDTQLTDREYLYDYNNNTYITIDNFSKLISKTNNYQNDEDNMKTSLERYKYFLTTKSKEYKKLKYEGNEIIEGKEYIKITRIFKGGKITFYIDPENKWISQLESYNKVGFKYELIDKAIFIYSYGTVTDDDILKFDVNNYPDYEYEEYWEDAQ